MATSKDKAVELSIIVPVFNEAKNFPNTYNSIKKNVSTESRVIVVYDFEEDSTVPVVRRLMKKDSSLTLVKNKLGKGPLNALKAGFKVVKSGPVLVVMADLSDDLRDADAMVALYRRGYTVVCGSRYMQGGRQEGGPFIKRTLSRLAGVTLHYIRRVPTHDITNNFKLYDSRFLQTLTIESTKGFSVAMEITIKAFIAGKKITEIPTTWNDRTDGVSNFKLLNWLPQYIKWYVFALQPKRPSK